MQLILTINCSAKKTAFAPKYLQASSLAKAALPALAAEWRARVARGSVRLRADTLYNGRAFGLGKGIAESAGADLRILSAGMGLVKQDALIPSYSLSVVPNTKDNILDRALWNATFSAPQWWRAIQSENRRRPIADLLRKHPRALVVIAANSPYIEMVSDELTSLADALLSRVRIIGVKGLPSWIQPLRECVMPYDARLNDIGRTLRGTEFDYPARALTHFVNLVGYDRKLGSIRDHARRVRQSLAHFCAPKRISHKRINDEKLRLHIEAFKRHEISKSNALDILRHEKKLACEQSRFSRVWATVKAKDL